MFKLTMSCVFQLQTLFKVIPRTRITSGWCRTCCVTIPMPKSWPASARGRQSRDCSTRCGNWASPENCSWLGGIIIVKGFPAALPRNELQTKPKKQTHFPHLVWPIYTMFTKLWKIYCVTSLYSADNTEDNWYFRNNTNINFRKSKKRSNF